MRTTIAFDVYGTLVNPLAMAEQLKSLVGTAAEPFAELWRTKQLEYSFRRGLMRAYQPFSICTWEALLYTEKAHGVTLGEESRAHLMQQYKQLPPFTDAAPGLTSLKRDGYLLAAFSNGETDVIRGVLDNANLLPLFDDIVSADEIKTFKPDPAIYAHATRRLGHNLSLVSSNPFDIIGAKSAGLRTIWIRRDPKTVFDPWGIEPDLVMSGLDQFASSISK